MYNYFLDEKKKQYEETKTSDSYNVQQSKLTLLRKTDGYEFLKDVPLQVLQCSLRNMHTAYDNSISTEVLIRSSRAEGTSSLSRLHNPTHFISKITNCSFQNSKAGLML